MSIGIDTVVKYLRGGEKVSPDGDLYLVNIPEEFFRLLDRFVWKPMQEFPYHQKVMPEVEPVPYLFCCTRGKIYVAKYDFDGFDHHFEFDQPYDAFPEDTVTHWMPAPELPAAFQRRLIYHAK